MISILRSGVAGRRICGSKMSALALVAAVSAGGCSADIARFDFPSANLNDTSTGAIPTPSEPVGGRSNLGADAPAGPAPVAGYESTPPALVAKAPSTLSDQRINVTALPPPPSATPSYGAPARVPAAPLAVAPEEKGEEIEVKRGDTLFGLSQRHKVSLNELMRVNGLTSPALKPGQRLSLPSGKVVPRTPQPAQTAAITAVPAPSDWTGSYTVMSGDSLYGIARQSRVRLEDLQRYNGIADVRRVKPGAVLKIPGIAGAALAEAPAASAPTAAPLTPATTRVLTPPPVPPVTSAASTAPAAPSALPTILNSQRPAEEQRKVAALETESRSDAPQASGSVAEAGKLRWPVKGRIITAFGQRTDGTHNDGINISVPMGTEIHAAEGGSVAYAGSELKGYGNLVLIRHDNGWVTAYAHAEELLVKRGDKVARGQVIAKAGKTGQVDQPQLHFEVRQGQKPVDPTPHLERL